MQAPLARAWRACRWAELVDASPGTPSPTEVKNPACRPRSMGACSIAPSFRSERSTYKYCLITLPNSHRITHLLCHLPVTCKPGSTWICGHVGRRVLDNNKKLNLHAPLPSVRMPKVTAIVSCTASRTPRSIALAVRDADVQQKIKTSRPACQSIPPADEPAQPLLRNAADDMKLNCLGRCCTRWVGIFARRVHRSQARWHINERVPELSSNSQPAQGGPLPHCSQAALLVTAHQPQRLMEAVCLTTSTMDTCCQPKHNAWDPNVCLAYCELAAGITYDRGTRAQGSTSFLV